MVLLVVAATVGVGVGGRCAVFGSIFLVLVLWLCLEPQAREPLLELNIEVSCAWALAPEGSVP